MLDKVGGLTNCSSCVTTKRINYVDQTIARCIEDGDLYACKCSRNYQLNSPDAKECTHAFAGKLWPVLLNYVYVLPLLVYATHIITVILRKKVRNALKRAPNRGFPGEQPGCRQKTKACLYGNKVIFALNSLMVFVFARLFLTVVGGAEGMNQVLPGAVEEIIVDTGSKSGLVCLAMVGAVLYEVRASVIAMGSSKRKVCNPKTIAYVFVLFSVLGNFGLGVITLVMYRVIGDIPKGDMGGFELARNLLGPIWQSIFGLVFLFSALFFGAKTIHFIYDMGYNSATRFSISDSRKKKLELVLVLAFYLLASSIIIVFTIATLVVCDIMDVRSKSPLSLATCYATYRTFDTLLAFVACRIFEGTLRSSMFTCCKLVRCCQNGDSASFKLREHIQDQDMNLTSIGEVQLSDDVNSASASEHTTHDPEREISAASVMMNNAKVFLTVANPLSGNRASSVAGNERQKTNLNSWSR
jgi:hypothetical protein|eukprot:g3506.t1